MEIEGLITVDINICGRWESSKKDDRSYNLNKYSKILDIGCGKRLLTL